jgi:hypothetical protein
MQKELTNSLVRVRISENEGEAALVRARKQAEQLVVTAEAESQQRVLAGRGEGSRLLQVGLSEASVLLRKIQSFGDPRLYSLTMAAQHLAHSTQPLVPQRVFMAGTSSNGSGSPSQSDVTSQGLLGLLINLLVAEKSGFQLAGDGVASLEEFAEKMTREALQPITEPSPAGAASIAAPVEAPGTPSAPSRLKPSSAPKQNGGQAAGNAR